MKISSQTLDMSANGESLILEKSILYRAKNWSQGSTFQISLNCELMVKVEVLLN
jgi:hypothetical protein